VIEVTRHKAASRTRMGGSVVFATWRQCAPPYNTCFLGPTRVYISNSILIGSAVFVGLTNVTGRQTPRYSVCNNMPHLQCFDAA